LNAKIGREEAKTSLLVWATCNDEEVLRSFDRGSLWSRFAHRYYCPGPSRDLMWNILLREVSLMQDGDLWGTDLSDGHPGGPSGRPIQTLRYVCANG
jgi:hypothetical protein